MKKYRSMRKAYYDLKQQPDAVQQELLKRRESASSILLDFQIDRHPAFISYCDEMIGLITEIHKSCRQVDKLIYKLPSVAVNQFIHQALVDEIQQSNEIENVRSTRKEIRESMEDIHSGRRGKRFDGMIRQYRLLQSNEEIPLKSCRDMRSLYDNFVLEEVIKEDPDNAPDGLFFRSQTVGVYDHHDKCIHKGVFPEATINDAMEHALTFLNDDSYDLFIRTAAFHYMFGYIHPFYDGNGRMTRFISCYMLSYGEVPLPICLRLSYVIKNNRKKYYELFRNTNDRHNYGDLTAFVLGFLDMILDACRQTIDSLHETEVKIQHYGEVLEHLDVTEDQRQELFILIQLSLCSDRGMGIEELADICGISRTKLINDMKPLTPYCIKWTEGRKYLYRANLEAIDSKVEESLP